MPATAICSSTAIGHSPQNMEPSLEQLEDQVEGTIQIYVEDLAARRDSRASHCLLHSHGLDFHIPHCFAIP